MLKVLGSINQQQSKIKVRRLMALNTQIRFIIYIRSRQKSWNRQNSMNS